MISLRTQKSRSERTHSPQAVPASVLALIALLMVGSAAAAQGAGGAEAPTIIVTGSGDVSAAPDRAAVNLGAVAEAKQAIEAQKQLNQIMQRVVKDIKAMGIADEKIRTDRLSLYPVYSNPGRKTDQEPEAPRIVSYRATNTVRVQVDDLERVGSVIDAGITAGANQLANLSFELRDDGKYRQQALKLAAQEARVKAEAIAAAMNLQLGEVVEIREEGARMPYSNERKYAAPASAATQIQPGQIEVSAGVSIRFKLNPPKP
jgi:uncharacterized protein YggE